MGISQLCKEDFSGLTRTRGSTYFRSGRVERVRVDGEGLNCEVRGSNGQRYQVSLEWDRDVWGVMARCTCPHYERGDLCKHVWAALLEADQASWPGGVTPERVRAEHPLGLASIDVYHTDDTELFMDPLPGGPESFGLKWGGEPIVREADWLVRLGTLLVPEPSGHHSPFAPYRQPQPDRVAWYVLDILRSRQEGTPVVVFAHRPRLKSGELGKPRTQAVYREDLPLYEQDVDRKLMQALLGHEAPNGYGYPISQTSCRLPPVLYDVLMPRMCATGRTMLRLEPGQGFDERGSGCPWDEAEWILEVDVAPDSARARWRFEGALASGERRRPIGEALLLFAEGLVVFADCVAKLRLTTEQVRWLDALRAGPIDVPFSSRAEFNRFWWAAQAPPPIALPEGLAYETAFPTPVGILSIGSEAHPRAGGERLRADVSVQYGAWMLPLGEPGWGVVDEANERVLMRDFQAEARLSGEIDAIGLRAAGSYAPGSFTLTPRQMPNLVAELSGLGWQIGYEGVRVRVPGAMSVALSSGTDWFDLEGSVDFAGVSADLPTLLKAVRRNEDYVTLPDGSRGWLNEEWRARHLAWADLAEVNDDVLRFRPGQALMLDILLDAQHAERRADPGFVQLRDRLRAVDSVEPAPAPATFKGTLRGYQKDGLGWLEFLRELNLGGCLADDMGLGKTVQVLALLEVERVRGGPRPGTPSLIVVPRSLVFNWMAEAARFTPNLTLCEYGGSGRPAQRERFSEVDVVITTYGTLRRDILELAERPFHYVVLDEAQVIKNPRSQVAKACRVLNATHRLAVTGTPVENHLGDLWSISEFLNPGLLGRSEPFNKLAREARSSEAAQEMAEALGRGLRPFILRRTKEQAAPELPPKTEQTLVCELGPRQRKLYDELRDHYRAALAERVDKVGLQRAKVHVLEALLRLRQVACHQALVDPSLSNESSAKLDVLSQHLIELAGEGRKVLVFSQFTKLLALVRHRLDRDGLGYEYLDGRTRDREARVRRFQDSPDALAFLISLKAGGQGLNLTDAEYVFVLDPWWNPAVEAQAVDRTHRIGQTRPVFAYRLIAGNTVEQKVVEMQRHKRRLADAIVSQNQSVLGDLSLEDLDLLLS